jgi:hypothetical protein
VTRGTRPKKPSSSRGFAREARGARRTREARRARGSWGSWGLKTENIFSPLFQPATTAKKNFYFIFFDVTAAGRGARRGLDGMPDGARRGARRGQMGWRTVGVFTFKRKNDMLCIRVM